MTYDVWCHTVQTSSSTVQNVLWDQNGSPSVRASQRAYIPVHRDVVVITQHNALPHSYNTLPPQLVQLLAGWNVL